MQKGIARLPYNEYTKAKIPILKKYWNTKIGKFRKELRRQGIRHTEKLEYVKNPINLMIEPILIFEYDIPGGE